MRTAWYVIVLKVPHLAAQHGPHANASDRLRFRE